MNLPEEYIARMRALPDADGYFSCLDEPPVRGVRVNTLKISPSRFLSEGFLQTDGAVSWAENCFYIKDEKPGKSLAFAAGLFYVQEPSAACAAPLLRAKPGERILDLCSAPGGKGTQLAAAMRGEGILVLNEKIPSRAAILSENVMRQGVRNAVVTCADPEALEARFENYFDKILVDAPCSGEGMFRKEPAALAEWSGQNVRMCADRQRKILNSAAKMLLAGGRLVYSTCTFSEEEDEKNAAWLAERGFSLIEEHKLYPHRVRGEGHYAAVFEKTAANETETGAPARLNANARARLPRADKRSAALWRAFEGEFFAAPLSGELLRFGNALYLAPEGVFPLDGLKVLRSGVRLGEISGDRFEPDHALALAADGENFCNANELSDVDAAKYLRGEEVPSACGKGWCAATWHGFALGLGKSVGGVMKNKYPKSLRRP